jgi:addiction module HigA family antidote
MSIVLSYWHDPFLQECQQQRNDQQRKYWIRKPEIKMVRIPTNRAPTHPGEMLLEEFLNPMGLTQRELADGIRVPYQRVNEIVHGSRGITPSTALRLAKFFDMSADFWMNVQLRWDLYFARQDENNVLEIIHPYSALSPSQGQAN